MYLDVEGPWISLNLHIYPQNSPSKTQYLFYRSKLAVSLTPRTTVKPQLGFCA